MHEYYRRRMQEAPLTACIVIGCMLLAGLIIVIAAVFKIGG